MPIDKYNAIWVSHSSMGDFLKCPRAYYLHNVYKDPKTGRKINIVNPALSLGIAVHEVLEGLAKFKAENRFKKPLRECFMKSWSKVSGKKGGFLNNEEEMDYKERAMKMIEMVEKNPGPLLEKTVRLKDSYNGMPPNFFLSEKDNIILCGKIDWLIYKPEDDSIQILDFKTGKNEEKEESLQLPIYQLLLKNLQKRKITGASYWYLDRDEKPIGTSLPDLKESLEKVSKVAYMVKEARDRSKDEAPEKIFLCPRGNNGCFSCLPFEKIIKGEAECVGIGEMRQDLYLVREK